MDKQRFELRAARARKLAAKYPASAEPLEFLAAISEAQSKGLDLPEIHGLLRRVAPEPLASAVATDADVESYLRLPDPFRLSSIHARILLEQHPPDAPVVTSSVKPACPRCGHPAQLGVLRPVGEGAALTLACSLCRSEWSASRRTCPVCESEAIEFYSAPEYPAITTQTCGECFTYFHIVDAGKDPDLVPEADELAAQPLDIWALDHGYTKIFPNWAGL
ncbi:MAG: formate dehydrogenase accessory protein FdhE [Bryobacterales bacterium]|nr:formate dehydrogenase accessory protein FdhE [Bryobacterales bacterium]